MRRLGFLFIIAVTVTGCLIVRYPYIDNIYHNPHFDEFNVRDVAFVSFDMDEIGVRSPFREEIIERVNRIFMNELERRNWYRVHRLTMEDLKDLEKTSFIDAVITGKITAYREREPLRFGLSVVMKSLDTGQTLWSAAYIFDAANKDVVAAMRDYYNKRIYPHHPLLGYRAFVISINKFIEFCCNAIIDTVILEQDKDESEGNIVNKREDDDNRSKKSHGEEKERRK